VRIGEFQASIFVSPDEFSIDHANQSVFHKQYELLLNIQRAAIGGQSMWPLARQADCTLPFFALAPLSARNLSVTLEIFNCCRDIYEFCFLHLPFDRQAFWDEGH
jgi:hypothetical protein